MPFVKDTSYRSLPFSPETPSDGTPCYITIRQLNEKISKTSQGNMYRCRTLGVIKSEYGRFVLYEMGSRAEAASIPLCFDYYTQPVPYAGQPYLAQVFGFVENKGPAGVVLSPHLVMSVPSFAASRVSDLMQWLVSNHYTLFGAGRVFE